MLSQSFRTSGLGGGAPPSLAARSLAARAFASTCGSSTAPRAALVVLSASGRSRAAPAARPAPLRTPPIRVCWAGPGSTGAGGMISSIGGGVSSPVAVSSAVASPSAGAGPTGATAPASADGAVGSAVASVSVVTVSVVTVSGEVGAPASPSEAGASTRGAGGTGGAESGPPAMSCRASSITVSTTWPAERSASTGGRTTRVAPGTAWVGSDGRTCTVPGPEMSTVCPCTDTDGPGSGEPCCHASPGASTWATGMPSTRTVAFTSIGPAGRPAPSTAKTALVSTNGASPVATRRVTPSTRSAYRAVSPATVIPPRSTRRSPGSSRTRSSSAVVPGGAVVPLVAAVEVAVRVGVAVRRRASASALASDLPAPGAGVVVGPGIKAPREPCVPPWRTDP